MKYTITDWFKVNDMLAKGTDYIICTDNNYAIINLHNGQVESRRVNDSANIDDWEVIETTQIK